MTGFKITTHKSPEDLVSFWTNGSVGTMNGLLYRGHARTDWMLMPTLYRGLFGELRVQGIDANTLDTERLSEVKNNYLGGLKAMKSAIVTSGLVHSADLTDDAVWTLGRHFGLSTPHLDLTASPFIALFFALTDWLELPLARRTKKVSVWEVKINGLLRTVAVAAAENTPKVKEICEQNPHVNERLVAQQGRLIDISCPTSLEQVARSLNDNSHLVRHDVALGIGRVKQVESAIRTLALLRKMNITFQSLFPGMEGAAKHANLATWHPDYTGM